MKFSIRVYIIIAILFLIGCQKKSYIKKDGVCSATLNGAAWKANGSSGKVFTASQISLNLSIYKNPNKKSFSEKESLSFIIIKKLSRQKLKTLPEIPFAAFRTFVDDGHTTNEAFYVYEADTTNNWIEITKQEDDFRYIEGVFSLTLVKVSRGPDPNRFPDTLRIRDGRFEVNLQ